MGIHQSPKGMEAWPSREEGLDGGASPIKYL